MFPTLAPLSKGYPATASTPTPLRLPALREPAATEMVGAESPPKAYAARQRETFAVMGGACQECRGKLAAGQDKT